MAPIGDRQGALQALQALLRAVKAPPLSAAAVESPVPLLGALSYLLCTFSKTVSACCHQHGLQLRGASDQRLVEGALRFARDALGLRTPLTAAQFLSSGQFAELRLQLVADIARACREMHNAAARQERLAALRACNAEQRVVAAAPAPSKQPSAAPRPKAHSSSSSTAPSGIPKPLSLPCVRVVGGSQQLASQALAAPEMPEAESSRSEGGESAEAAAAQAEAATPTSVIAAAASHQAGFAPGSKQPLPAMSPAERPRPLPPALLPAPPVLQQGQGLGGAYQQQQYAEPGAGAWAVPLQPQQAQQPDAVQQPEAQCDAAAAQQQLWQQPAALPASAYPQLAAPHLQQPLPQPSAQQQQQPLPQPSAQQQQQQQQQQQHGQLACSGGGQAQQQVQRHIEDLQLRLVMAEEAAATARHEEQQAREEMQARLCVLEGRVRFLEAGYSRPELHLALPAPAPQMQLLCGASHLQPQQPQPLALPWTAPSSSSMPASLQGPSVGWGAPAPRSVAGGDSSGAACGQQREQPPRLNPLFDAQHPAPASALPPSTSWQQPPSGVGSGTQAAPAEAVHWEPPPLPPVPAQHSSYESASELINSMQARFSEADEFLLSLRWL